MQYLIPTIAQIFLILVLMFSYNPYSEAQTISEIVNKFVKRSYTFENTTIPYRLFIPEDYDSAKTHPLILSLHGAGERGTDNEKHILPHGHATS